MTDVGMSGDFDSVIGMAKDEPLQRFLRRISAARFEPAAGRPRSVALGSKPMRRPVLPRKSARRAWRSLEQAAPTFGA